MSTVHRGGSIALFACVACLACLATTLGNACGSFAADATPAGGPDASLVETGAQGGEGGEGGAMCGTANVASDPANCGRCGHSCLGGDCRAGVCRPFVFASLTVAPIAIALDEKRVVWSDGPRIFNCPKEGCPATPSSLSGAGVGFADLAGSAKHTFFASGGGPNGHVGRLGLDDSYDQVGAAPGYPFRVATDGIVVVALDDDNDNDGLYYGLAATPESLVPIAPRLIPGEMKARNYGYLATNGTHAFAADYGSIMACTLPSCASGWSTAAGLNPYLNGITGIAATSTDLYWTTQQPPALNTCSLTTGLGGCGVGRAIAGSSLPTGGVPHDVFIEDGRLYVAAGTKLGSCIPESCDASWVTYLEDQVVRGRAAVDATAIYWISFDVPPPADAAVDPDAGPPPASPPTNVRIMKLVK
jgi:hypothetical protein